MAVTKRKLYDLKSEYIQRGFNQYQYQQQKQIYSVQSNKENKENVSSSNIKRKYEEPPNPTVKRKITYLGVVNTDPNEYVRKYGNTLVKSEQLPTYVKKIPNPPGIELVSLLFFGFQLTFYRNIVSLKGC
jgi:hypothetical protein